MVEQSSRIQMIQQAYPELAVQSINEQRGQFNDIVLVNDQYVFRFPRSQVAQETLAREIAILNVVRDRVSLPVPDPRLSGGDPGSGESRFMGYEMIPGRALTYSDVREANRERLARQLAEFLQELHAVPLDALPVEIETSELPAAWASFYRDVCDHLFPHMREEARGRIAGQFEAYFEDPHRYAFDTCLRHGDFGAGNIIWDPDEQEIAGIIDFGSCGPGDPAQDLGAILVSLGSNLAGEMYRHYPELEAMYDRAVFYTGTYAMQQALAALHAGDDALFEDGIGRFR